MILNKIIETKKEEVEQLKKQTTVSALERTIARLEPCRSFRQALISEDCNIIAEVKCASPSRGRLIADFDPVRIAGVYEQNGAAAISVLTDEKYFAGHKNYLTQIRQKVKLPLLRKDFIIDPLQIYETRAIGADAILLIVHVLGKKLSEFILLSKELGLNSLVEVHTEEELDLALAADAEIPADKIVVAESGIITRADIESLMQADIHAFLIGEALITVLDIGKELRELKGVS
jgi:indole-3-glycerol phosphate synthase